MIQALGWALVHFLWQGASIALALAVTLWLLRQASATARYAAASGALLLMLAAPVATFLWLQHPAVPATATPLVFAALHSSAPTAPALSAEPLNSTPAPSPTPWLGFLVAAWAAGVAVLSLRIAGGLVLTRRLKLWATPVTCREWRVRLDRLCDRIGLRQYVSLFESALADVPMAVGWLEPMILLPAGALLQLAPEQMEAILAHELAHIRRLDYPVNLLQTAVETLLFYHPAVWWVGRRIRQERENCCDDIAVEICGDAVGYARALVELETYARRSPRMAVAATGGSLAERIKRLVVPLGSPRRTPGAGLAAVLLLLAMVGTWVSLLPMLHAAGRGAEKAPVALQVEPAGGATPPLAGKPGGAQAAMASKRAAAAEASRESAPAGVSRQSSPAAPAGAAYGARAGLGSKKAAVAENAAVSVTAVIARLNGMAGEAALQDAARAGSQQSESGQRPQAPGTAEKQRTETGSPYVQAISDAGYPNLSVDELIAFKIQGVTPEYIREIRAAGFQPEPKEIISLKVMGVTPEFARQMKQVFPDISLRELVSCRVQGVNPAVAQQLNGIGFGKLSVRQVITARIFNIDADMARQLKQEGFSDLTFNQAVAARVQGVTPEFASGLKSAGFPDLKFDQAIAAHVQGLTPAFVQGLKSAGFTDLTINQAIAARIQGLTPDYVQGMKSAGFPDLKMNQAIVGRIQGLTPEYVRSLREAGFPNLTFDDALRARIMGLTPEFARQAQQHGFKNLTIEKLIELQRLGVLSPQ